MRTRPRVLMVLENQGIPADTRVWPEALALRDAGFAVSVIGPMVGARHRAPREHIDGIAIYRYRLPSGETAFSYLVEYAVALVMTCWLGLGVALRPGFDAIHIANPPDIFFPLTALCRLCGKKVVFDQHDLAPELFDVVFADRASTRTARMLRRLLLLCERLTYRTADLVIATNESFRRVAMGRGRCPADKVVVVRNGPDLGLMRPAVPDPTLERRWRHALVYVGEMGVQDGVDNAVRALEILVHRRGRRDVGLILIGKGTRVVALRALAHELRLDEHVHFTGFVTQQEVARHLSAAEIGLCPDPYNAMNDACTMIKTTEYMAMGLPVVAFDLTETRYTAQDAALYATPNRVEEFADKIEALLDDETLRARMGACGRRRVEDGLSWAHSRAHLLRAYRELFGLPEQSPLTAPAASAVAHEPAEA